MSAKLLVLEDGRGLNQMLVLHFADEGLEAQGVTTCAAARKALRAGGFGLLLDQQRPDGTGIEILEWALAAEADCRW
jgi:DNA-binding response OmpR family regulator